MDNAIDKADASANQAKEANSNSGKQNEEVHNLEKKLLQVDVKLVTSNDALEKANHELEEKEKLLTTTESEVFTLNRKVQQIEEDLENSEKRSTNRSCWKLSRLLMKTTVCAMYWGTDPDKMKNVMTQKEARMLAEDDDTKSNEVSRKLAFVENELETVEDCVRSRESKIIELEEELKVVDNSLKTLEVSEEVSTNELKNSSVK